MHIGIIGMGNVGRALHHGFEKLGHTLSVHDKQLPSSVDAVLGAEIVSVLGVSTQT